MAPAITGPHYQYSGSTPTQHYYAGGARIGQRYNTTLYFHLTDHPSTSLRTSLGSTNLTTNESGVLSAELRYRPYGLIRYTTGTLNTPYRYTGQRFVQNTGLYFYNARWYDPTVGRFLAADTIVPEPGNPQALNRYTYTLNNPLRYTDPTGMFTEEEIMNYLGVKTWEEVLKMFEKSGKFAGAWGWLKVLRDAELGDTIHLWLDTSTHGFDASQADMVGAFTEIDGQLMIATTAGAILPGMGPAGILQTYAHPIMRLNGDMNNGPYIYNKKYTQLIFHPGKVDWVDVGLDTVGASGAVGYAMMGAGIVAVTAGTGGVGLLLGGVVISGVAAAADMTAAGKAVADYQRGGATGKELAVDMALGVGGVIPTVGTYADAASLVRDVKPGIYIGP